MFRLRSFLNTVLLAVVIFGTIFGLKWYDGYQKAKQQNSEITFGEYVKSDIGQMQAGLKELISIAQETKQSADNIKQSSINKLVAVLDLYHEDQGKYPYELQELVGEYIDEKSNVLNLEGLYYQKTLSGYELSIPLNSGEMYRITK